MENTPSYLSLIILLFISFIHGIRKWNKEQKKGVSGINGTRDGPPIKNSSDNPYYGRYRRKMWQ